MIAPVWPYPVLDKSGLTAAMHRTLEAEDPSSIENLTPHALLAQCARQGNCVDARDNPIDANSEAALVAAGDAIACWRETNGDPHHPPRPEGVRCPSRCAGGGGGR